MEVVATTEFRRDLLAYCFALIGWILFQILFSLTLEPSAERAGLTAPVRIALPIAEVFVVATIASFVISKWATSSVITTIRARISTHASLSDNRSSVLSDFGFNLFFGLLLGITILGQHICKWSQASSTSHSLQATLDCYLFAEFTTATLAGLGVGFILWIYLRVKKFEAESNSKIMVQKYRTRSWSFWIIAGCAGLTYVIVYAFYRIFTLGL